MSTQAPPSTKATLGLTGLTSNAMALIAPGAFLWLTFAMQSLYGAPMAGSDMWFGIVVALLLCFATAISYAELSKLYPGAGSSYFFAEQAFLSKSKAFKFARIAKFIVGWASHLYYWVYPGVMVGVTGLIVGYMAGQLFPTVFNPAVPSPLFMALFCVVFAFGVAYIAFRGVGGTTSVNAAINVIQISALVVFSIMAISYRLNHSEGAVGHQIDAASGMATTQMSVPVLDAKGNPVIETVKDADGKVVFAKDDKGNATTTPATQAATTMGAAVASYSSPIDNVGSTDPANPPTRQYFAKAVDVVKPHGFSFSIVQACVAILILVGFESVTAMGEEAKNPKKDIPRAVLLSLFIQGCLCYLLEYFAAEYFLSSNYNMTAASGSAAPIGDMMQMVGAYFFGSPEAGWWFMMVQAVTVFLALVGTTLSCLSTGARVTYAMGRDKEVGGAFGELHAGKLTPHKAIWTLAVVSAIIGVIAVFLNFCGGAAQTDDTIKACKALSGWYSFGLISHDTAAMIPQGICRLIVQGCDRREGEAPRMGSESDTDCRINMGKPTQREVAGRLCQSGGSLRIEIPVDQADQRPTDTTALQESEREQHRHRRPQRHARCRR
ncbi:MAG: APC family permease, partial [Phycisphaerae bacterium]